MIDLSELTVWLGALAVAASFSIYGFAAARSRRKECVEAKKARPAAPDPSRRFGAESLAAGSAILLLGAMVFFAAQSPSDLVFLVAGAVASLAAVAFLPLISGDLLKARTDEVQRSRGLSSVLFISGLSVLCLGLLQILVPGDEPEAWLFFGLGVSAVSWARLCAKISPKHVTPGQDASGLQETGPELVDDLSEIFTAVVLSFCVLMAMGYFIESDIEGWFQIPLILAGAGLIISVAAIGMDRILRGGRRPWVTGMAAVLFAGAAYQAVKAATDGVPSQALVNTGLLDRLGPFWAVVLGMATVFMVRALLCHHGIRSDVLKGKSPHLLGKTEGMLLILFFSLISVWISHLLAGYYGIALSAAGATAAFGLVLPPGRGGKAMPDSSRPPLWFIRRGYVPMCSFPVVSGALALLVLNLSDMARPDAVDQASGLMLAGTTGLGLFAPILFRGLLGGPVCRKAVLPVPLLVVSVLLIGGFTGTPGLAGFVAGLTLSGFIGSLLSLSKEEGAVPHGRELFYASLGKAAAFAVLAFLPLVSALYDALYRAV